MPDINLLPWRENRRKEARQRFWRQMLISALILFSLIIALRLWIDQQTSTQIRINSELKKRMTELSMAHAESLSSEHLETLKAQLTLNTERIRQRYQLLSLMNVFAQTIQPDLYLASIALKGQTLHITGYTSGNAPLSSYMRRIKQELAPFSPPELIDLSHRHSQDHFRYFHLKLGSQTQTGQEAKPDE